MSVSIESFVRFLNSRERVHIGVFTSLCENPELVAEILMQEGYITPVFDFECPCGFSGQAITASQYVICPHCGYQVPKDLLPIEYVEVL